MQVERVSRDQVIRNSFWKFCESIGIQLLQLIVTIILARILGPNEYGIMALVLAAINFVNLFINSSIASYLVYIKNIQKQDFFTALLVNFFVSLFLVVVLLFAAPSISKFYCTPQLVPLIRTMVIILPFCSISSIYNAYAIKMSLHKRLFVRNMIAIPISGIVALALAFTGHGIWSLLWQQLVYNILLAVIIVCTIKVSIDGEWRFKKGILRPMFLYGGVNLLTTFVAFFSDNINDLIIGKKIDSENLGYYNRGNTFPGVISNVINNLATGVFFPAFSTYRDNTDELREKFSKTIRLIYCICFPLFCGMAFCAGPFIRAVLTDKWTGAIPVIQYTCFFYVAIPFLQLSSQACLALGKLNIRMIGELVKMILTLIFLALFISHGIVVLAFSRVLLATCMIVFTGYFNKIYFQYSLGAFIKDVAPFLLVSSLMSVCVYVISLLNLPQFTILLIQVFVGLLVYIGVLQLINNEEWSLVRAMIINKMKRS